MSSYIGEGTSFVPVFRDDKMIATKHSRRQMRMSTQGTQSGCRRQHVAMIFRQRQRMAAARRHPDSSADGRQTRQLFAYEMLAVRRNKQDSMLWQAPALALPIRSAADECDPWWATPGLGFGLRDVAEWHHWQM